MVLGRFFPLYLSASGHISIHFYGYAAEAIVAGPEPLKLPKEISTLTATPTEHAIGAQNIINIDYVNYVIQRYVKVMCIM